jgi:hypothetical protein
MAKAKKNHTTKFHADDARIRAVMDTMDVNRGWCNHSKEEQLKAVKRWYEIINVWYMEHKERADSKEGIDSALCELRSAFRKVRSNKTIQQDKDGSINK